MNERIDELLAEKREVAKAILKIKEFDKTEAIRRIILFAFLEGYEFQGTVEKMVERTYQTA